MALTVKGAVANGEQVSNIALCCRIAKGMGATGEQMAGAIATMMQESSCINLHGGDRDSAGLFQQRPSAGWGTFAQVTNPDYACRKFLGLYLPACRRGMDVISASNTVQRSAFPQAPARWLPESRRDVSQVLGSKDFGDVTSSGLNISVSGGTRVEPYQFSRGSAGSPETSWDAMGRLATEVQWRRFMRGGALWFVSDQWLRKQTPRFNFAIGARGVLAISFEADSRRNVAEATVTALARRWSVKPGDVVTVSGRGPADGLWLVYDTRRTLADNSTEIQLRRPQPALPEPAPQTSTNTNVSVGKLGLSTPQAGTGTGPAQAQKLYAAAKAISDRHLPYVWGGGHASCGSPNGGGFDCSGSVCAALAAAGLGYRLGGPCDVSGTMAARYGAPGRGRWFTIWANSEHVWCQFTGCGPAWRFDTSPHGCGPDGPALRFCPRSTAGFTPRHWPGL